MWAGAWAGLPCPPLPIAAHTTPLNEAADLPEEGLSEARMKGPRFESGRRLSYKWLQRSGLQGCGKSSKTETKIWRVGGSSFASTVFK
jgi:hypothetical protein